MVVLVWIATYAVHSTLWLLPGIWFARRASIAPRSRATVLLVCVIAPFVTTAFSQLGQRGTSLSAPSLRIEDDRRIERTVDSVGNAETVHSGGLTFASRIAVLSITGVAALFALIAVGRSIATMRAQRRAVRDFGERTPVLSATWNSAYEQIVRTFALRYPPAFTSADRLASPVALHDEVCIPRTWTDRDDANEMRVVLAHEIEHVVWHDPLALTVLQFLRRALPWQPLLSLAMASYLEAAEEACDGAAIRCTGDAKSVAHVLLKLAPVQPAAIAFTNLNSGRGVRQRIERIVAMPVTMQRSPLAGAALVATLLVLSAALPHIRTPERDEAPNVDVRVNVTTGKRP